MPSCSRARFRLVRDAWLAQLPRMTSSRRFEFEHDGHRFEGFEREGRTADGAEREVHWVIRMDGKPALEFHGPYPYRDSDIRKRILEWYEIQRGPDDRASRLK